MRYLVHVINDSYAYDIGHSEVVLMPQTKHSGEKNWARTIDAFYLIEDATSETDAIVQVANKAKVVDQFNEEITSSEAFDRTIKGKEDGDEDYRSITLEGEMSYDESTRSHKVVAEMQFKKDSVHGDWIELHKIYFYVITQTGVVRIR